jgi:hypothetical protein
MELGYVCLRWFRTVLVRCALLFINHHHKLGAIRIRLREWICLPRRQLAELLVELLLVPNLVRYLVEDLVHVLRLGWSVPVDQRWYWIQHQPWKRLGQPEWLLLWFEIRDFHSRKYMNKQGCC